MTTALDIKAAATAERLLLKFGATGSYIHRSGAEVYDPATSTLTPSESTLPGVKMFIGSPTQSDLKMGVLVTELVLYISSRALTFGEPTANDRVILKNRGYRVRPVQAVYSGDDVALWVLAALEG